MSREVAVYRPANHVRMITATALFDGHDASINIMRRIMQETGVEVIHLGHNRSVAELVDAAIDEDAQGIAMSSYQGGHMESFRYMVDLLRQRDAGHIRVFGGGGGVIVEQEIKALEAYGVSKIYSPEDGARLGLQGMINHMVEQADFSTAPFHELRLSTLDRADRKQLAGLLTAIEEGWVLESGETVGQALILPARASTTPVIGITGTGGAGKSSLTDEILLRFLQDAPQLAIAVVCCDPSRRKTGGALLGDRIRMNTLTSYSHVYLRSLATRSSASEVSAALPDAVALLKAAGFDLIVVETAGIGQGDSRITDLSDLSLYVMTGEYGAASQLEKIDMLDYADLIVVNKYEKKGSEDAVRDIRKQVQRNQHAWDRPLEEMEVYGTIAARFNDDGVTALYHGLMEALAAKSAWTLAPKRPRPGSRVSNARSMIIPRNRLRYLAEIAETVQGYHRTSEQQSGLVRQVWHLEQSQQLLGPVDSEHEPHPLTERAKEIRAGIAPSCQRLLDLWPEIRARYGGDHLVSMVAGREVRIPLTVESLSGLKIPRLALPRYQDPGEVLAWLRREHLPGHFPYTAGVFPLKRMDEDPTRMFAGEGGPKRTNHRFRLLSAESTAKRLSTAFDSVTLYGWDPDRRPDIYGKVGTAGVSVCCLDDIRDLYDGFDLCAPTTSVSMTINGPAPIILAMFLNTAVDQQVARCTAEQGAPPSEAARQEIQQRVLATIRGTVQADILKEDQGQNTCIFSIDFALKMMGDIQEYFIEHRVRHFYSVSVSGYHIAEAGANPITQLALTLANGFTYVEYYLARGMVIDAIAPRLSFFFSNGMDPEYTVIGRVARRIWAVALRERYGADEQACRLKYHVQTSGRSLHSQEIQFNDIRTTLQALCAIYDNCNSLHTNAFDEAITTPSDASVRRALAIQMIINREWGLARNENPLQGSFLVETLTDLVEEAVLAEFDRLSSRGGVLGAMESGYQRSKIQEESLHYEALKHSGQHPIIGVNTFQNPQEDFAQVSGNLELARATEEEKEEQLERLAAFQARNREQAVPALARLKETVLAGGNTFACLMDTVRVCSLGQITTALYEVGGRYRRNM